jgi:hypothetical protein
VVQKAPNFIQKPQRPARDTAAQSKGGVVSFRGGAPGRLDAKPPRKEFLHGFDH